MSNFYSHYRSWTHIVRGTVCPIVCGTGGIKIHHSDGKLINGAGMNELPARQRINKIVIGINGAAGNPAACTPAMTGIGGHPDPPELMMKGGPRGHHGHIRFFLNRKKYFDKSPPLERDGSQPEETWRDYRRMLKQWLSTTDVPSEKHGMLLWRALTGDAKLLISHFRDEELLQWDAGQRIF